MKKKQLIALLFNTVLCITLVCSFLALTGIGAGAEETAGVLSLSFALEAEGGKQVVEAEPGDEITVSFVMRRTDAAEGYTTNGFQNYIHYDLDFFELVEDSIVCYGTGSATAKKQSSLTYGEIVQCQSMASSYEASFVFCSFKLRVIGTFGSGMVYNSEVYAFDEGYRAVPVLKGHLQVLFDSGCTHADKTKVDEKTSTCQEKGWSAHYTCDGCDAVFDASGESMIAGVPYTDEAHVFAETLTYDSLGHWYECTACGERSEYTAHNGGTATCQHKATCVGCEQEYGAIDAENHVGETVVKDRKTPWFLGDGYTGDVYCADCDELIEEGERIAMAPMEEWPGLIWIIVALLAILGLLFLIWLSNILE